MHTCFIAGSASNTKNFAKAPGPRYGLPPPYKIPLKLLTCVAPQLGCVLPFLYPTSFTRISQAPPALNAMSDTDILTPLKQLTFEIAFGIDSLLRSEVTEFVVCTFTISEFTSYSAAVYRGSHECTCKEQIQFASMSQKVKKAWEVLSKSQHAETNVTAITSLATSNSNSENSQSNGSSNDWSY